MTRLATLFSIALLAGTTSLALAGDFCPSKGMYGGDCNGHHQGPGSHCKKGKGFKQTMAGMTEAEREAFMEKRMAERLDHRLVRMTYKLDLTDQQQKQMREIMQNKQQQMQKIHKQTQEQIDKVLTEEQRKKLQQKRPV